MGKAQRVILDLIVLWGVLNMVQGIQRVILQGIQIADVDGDLGEDMTFNFDVSGLRSSGVSSGGIESSDTCCASCQENNYSGDAFVYSKSLRLCYCFTRKTDKDYGKIQTINGTGGAMPEPVAGICVAAPAQPEALALTVPISVTEKSCHNAAHGIPCCPVTTTGDNEGPEGENFVQEAQYDKDIGCAATCKKLYKTSAGITESKTQTYSNGGHKCWCEMGTPVLKENGGYQTCMFA